MIEQINSVYELDTRDNSLVDAVALAFRPTFREPIKTVPKPLALIARGALGLGLLGLVAGSINREPSAEASSLDDISFSRNGTPWHVVAYHNQPGDRINLIGVTIGSGSENYTKPKVSNYPDEQPGFTEAVVEALKNDPANDSLIIEVSVVDPNTLVASPHLQTRPLSDALNVDASSDLNVSCWPAGSSGPRVADVKLVSGGVGFLLKNSADPLKNIWHDSLYDGSCNPETQPPTLTPTPTTFIDPQRKLNVRFVSPSEGLQQKQKVTAIIVSEYPPGQEPRLPNGRLDKKVTIRTIIDFGVSGTDADRFEKDAHPGRKTKASYDYNGAGSYEINASAIDPRDYRGSTKRNITTPLDGKSFHLPGKPEATQQPFRSKPNLTPTATPTQTRRR